MATILDKEVVRDTTVLRDNKLIQITLTDKQEILLNIKGSKKPKLTIPIGKLYDYLENGGLPETDEKIKPKHEGVINTFPMMNIHEFRALNAISSVDLKTKIQIDSILALIVEKNKKISY